VEIKRKQAVNSVP